VAHQNVGGLDVLVDKAAPMDLREGRRDGDGKAQKAAHLHGRAEEALERLAAWALKHHRRFVAHLRQSKPMRRRPLSPVRRKALSEGLVFSGTLRALVRGVTNGA
jgi:hypothetical protein